MNITVFGANGKVGSLVVNLLLKKNHNVLAFVHGNNNFSKNPNLKISQGDIRNKQEVSDAVKGADLVISTLGSWGTKTKDIQVAGMTNIIPSMRDNSVSRIISLTGSDAYAAGDKKSVLFFITHAMLSVLAGKILYDGEKHLEMLENSDLEWTVLRSPVMNEAGHSADYTLSNKRSMPWHTINRNSVAKAMVGLIESSEYVKKSPFIKRK